MVGKGGKSPFLRVVGFFGGGFGGGVRGAS